MKFLSIGVIKEGGAAQKLALQPHDLIYEINGQRSADPNFLTNNLKLGNTVLTILRDYQTITVTVTESSLGAILGETELDEQAFARERDLRTMPLLTTPTVPGKTVGRSIGLVSAQVIDGTNILADIAGGIRDIVGGRAAGLEARLAKAREGVCHDIRAAAYDLGANAVVGLNFTYSDLGDKGGFILLVAATGTAVVTD